MDSICMKKDIREHYIPLREYLLENLDKTIMIAQDGVNYLVEKYPCL